MIGLVELACEFHFKLLIYWSRKAFRALRPVFLGIACFMSFQVQASQVELRSEKQKIPSIEGVNLDWLSAQRICSFLIGPGDIYIDNDANLRNRALAGAVDLLKRRHPMDNPAHAAIVTGIKSNGNFEEFYSAAMFGKDHRLERKEWPIGKWDMKFLRHKDPTMTGENIIREVERVEATNDPSWICSNSVNRVFGHRLHGPSVDTLKTIDTAINGGAAAHRAYLVNQIFSTPKDIANSDQLNRVCEIKKGVLVFPSTFRTQETVDRIQKYKKSNNSNLVLSALAMEARLKEFGLIDDKGKVLVVGIPVIGIPVVEDLN